MVEIQWQNKDLVSQKNDTDYTSQEWYKKLSPEQQKTVDTKFEQKKDLEKKISDKKSEIKFKWTSINIIQAWLEKNKPLIKDKEDLVEINTFEERIDTMNRDIDRLSRDLYKLNLEANSSELTNSFEKSNDYFKKWLLKSWETNKDILQIIENKDLKTITAWEIYTLKQNWYDLSKLFLIWAWDVSKDNMNVWDSFKVNFWWNESLNRNIWAWDLLPIDKIDKVIINWVEWERKIDPRPGYYSADGKYLSVFDNYSIEIVSKKDFTPEEQQKSLEAFKNRYEEIRKPEILSNLREQLKSVWNSSEVKLDWFSKSDLEVIWTYLSKYLPKEIADNIEFDLEKGVIKTKNWESVNEAINKFVQLENLGRWFEKYKDIVIEVSSKYWIRPEKLITLINHENGRWDPLAWAPGSSAYGLWQMIDSTWAKYWKWLDRNDPKDQLDATCRYLVDIMSRKNCPVELAMAYYNTWEWIMSISHSKAQEYASKNPAISKKIPSWEGITPKSYFTAAVAYYNDTDYRTASTLV